jgi:hypothetical protein
MLLNDEISRGEYAEVFDVLTSYGIMPLMRENADLAGMTEISVFRSR